MSPIKRMTSAFSSAGDRSSRLPGGDMPLQNLKSLYVESPDLSIFTRAVAPCPPTAADSKTSAARTFAPITTLPPNSLINNELEGSCRECSAVVTGKLRGASGKLRVRRGGSRKEHY